MLVVHQSVRNESRKKQGRERQPKQKAKCYLGKDAHIDQSLDGHVGVEQELEQLVRLRPDQVESFRVDDGLDGVVANVTVDEDLHLVGVGLVFVVIL